MARKVSIAACQFVIKPVKDFDAFAAQSVKLLDDAKGAQHHRRVDVAHVSNAEALAG